MKRLFALSAVLMLPLSAETALAQCAPQPVADGDTVTCTGTDSDGFSSSFNDLTINVENGATVGGTTPGIVVSGTGVTINNDGFIESTGTSGSSEGIDGRDNLTVVNGLTGTIKSLNSRAIDVEKRNNVTIRNDGIIVAEGKAIRNQDGSSGQLVNTGSITSFTSEGYESGDLAAITNSGLIIAQDDAVQVGENASIVNSGTITSFANMTAGAEQQDAIDIDSGTIENLATGVIESEANAGIDFDGSIIESTITNAGRISGTTGILVDKGQTDPSNANTAAQIILNYGVIEGYDGLAVDVGAGNDVLSLFGGSKMIGGADMGDDNDQLNLFDDLSGDVAGGKALDGGAGIDMVEFKGLTIDDVLRAWSSGTLLSLVMKTPDSRYSVALRNWEDFRFDDQVFNRDQVLELAPVPLPAAGLLMVAGLGGLAALRRRRA